MKYRATKIFTFDAAHFLEGYDGKCSNIHGHTYKLEVTIEKARLNDQGFVCDFNRIKEIVEEKVINKYDHQLINDVMSVRPTAEKMAEIIFYELQFAFLDESAALVKIRLYETPTSYVEVIADE